MVSSLQTLGTHCRQLNHANSVASPTESDSDSEIESFTNRGNKLKKRARFAHKGQLMPTAGPGAYKEVPPTESQLGEARWLI